MKLRHPLLIRAAAWFGAGLVRTWLSTVRMDHYPLGHDATIDPRQPQQQRRYLYAFWHEYLLLPASRFGRPDIHVLISRHADGQLIADIAQRLGFSTVRGSTTRGGAEAVLEMLRATGHLAVTPDGPRGPRRQFQLGAIFLASQTGLPIVPLGLAFDRPWRAGSWDRFAVPRPFSRTVCVTQDSMIVPPNLNREGLEHWRQQVQAVMDRLTDYAERWLADPHQGRFEWETLRQSRIMQPSA